jgi:hypothetical protein
MKKLLALLFALLATPVAAQVIPSGPWGSLNYWGVGGASQVLNPGLAGQCLETQGVGSAPIWIACPGSSLALLPSINTNQFYGNVSGQFTSPVGVDVNTILNTVGYDISRPPAVESILYKSNVGPTFNWQTLPPGPLGQILTSGGPTNPPFWSTSPTQSNLASICQIVGAILYYDTPSLQWKCLAPGSAGQLLQTGGASGNPSWLTRNVNTTAPLNGGGPLSGDLTLSLTSPLPVANGGTGVSNGIHLVVYTVAPSGASAADKLKADFVGDGVNDQNAVNSAVTAARAISSYSKVEMLPGVYNFSAATANLCGASGQNGSLFEARGTIVNGPGVGGAATALDTFVIQNCNFAELNFGSIKTNNTGTAAAIHSTGNYSETKITWQALDGTARSGYGFFADTTGAATSQSVNWITATHVQNFAKGVVLSSAGAGANIDTYRVSLDYVFNNVIGIYVHASGGGGINSNVWNVNIDPSHTAGDIAFETNASFDVINGIVGGLASGSHNFVLDSGATANILNLTPISLAAAAGSILDSSGNTTNVVNGSVVDGFLNGLNQLIKYDGATNGAVSRTGLSLGTIGTINTLSYFSASGVLSSLATANNGVLVTSGGGVPSISSTLPSGIAAANMAISGTGTLSGTYTGNLQLTGGGQTLTLGGTLSTSPYDVGATGTGGPTNGGMWNQNNTQLTFTGLSSGYLWFNHAANTTLLTLSNTGLLTALTETANAHMSNGTVPVGTTGSCVASSFVGGATAGKFSAAVCTAGTIILSSLPAAPNGYSCNAQDQTTPADTLKQTANTTTSATFTSTTVAADIVVFQCMGW